MSATQDQTIVLITGANGGIGFELASQLLQDPSKHVLLGARSPEKGNAAVSELQSRKLPGTVEFLKIDVSDEASIKEAAKEVEAKYGRLDALVNNAGVASVGDESTLYRRMQEAYLTNTVGPVIVTKSFAPLLKKSAGTPRIVNLSSISGSIAVRLHPSDPTYELDDIQYRASKAALNMVTACQAVDYGKLGWKVFSYCPGLTTSNMSDFNKPENGAKPTSDGARPIVDMLNGKRDAEHGAFLHEHGQHPW
ncbi:NAD(P)-binding protein [Corynespora cassiicola Philippines]|uniref:NAD(P)-binding protein n=1 Tax=Corynespora cassiicola Philippines TaxID=1448308 RepID=A0A2T2PA59_CORCC|nr:NAD(P)-binding protein [Corynespora cassiicola Philippines]